MSIDHPQALYGTLRHMEWLANSLVLIVGLPPDRRKLLKAAMSFRNTTNRRFDLPRTVSPTQWCIPHRVILIRSNRMRTDGESVDLFIAEGAVGP